MTVNNTHQDNNNQEKKIIKIKKTIKSFNLIVLNKLTSLTNHRNQSYDCK